MHACTHGQKALATVVGNLRCVLFFGMDSASTEYGDGELYPGFCSGKAGQRKAGFSVEVAI